MKKDIKITKLTDEMLTKLIELIEKDKNEHDRTVSEDQKALLVIQLTELIEKNNPLTLIALLDNKIVGYINGHIIPFPLLMNKECYISCLLVDSEHRGNKIGHKLLEHLELIAKQNDCSKLMLNNPKVYESYKREFYTKENFTERDNFANFIKQI